MMMLQLIKEIVSEDVDVKQRLISKVQTIINDSLDEIRAESEDWGLGEMDELDEVDSIERITINRIVTFNGIKVYINIITNSDREDFNNIRSEIQYRLEQLIPSLRLIINEIIEN